MARSALTQRRLSPRNFLYSLRARAANSHCLIPTTLNPFTSDFTLAMWFKCSALPKSNTPFNDTNLYAQQDGAGVGRSWVFIDRATNKLATFFNGVGNTTNFCVTQGQWYMLHLLWDHLTTQLDFYIDASPISGGSIVTPVESATGSHAFLDNKAATGPRFINGTELRLYSRKLTPTEIGDHYFDNITPGGGLDTEILFTEGAGTTAADTSGNAHHATLTTPIWTTDRPPCAQRTLIGAARSLISGARSLV